MSAWVRLGGWGHDVRPAAGALPTTATATPVRPVKKGPKTISQLPACRRPVAVMRRASLAYSNADTVGLTPDRHRSPVRDAADRVRCLQRRSDAHRWGIDAACWKGHYQLKSDNCYADHATLAITPGCRTPRKVGLLGGPGLSTLRGPRAVAPRRRWRRPASSER